MGVMRWIAVALGVLLLVQCSNSGNSDGDRTTRAVIDGQDVRIDAPTTGGTEAVAVWLHGHGGDVDTRMNEPWLNALREKGWSIASGDLGGGTAWGDTEAVDAAKDLVQWAEQYGPVRLIIAGSMGAVTALNANLDAPCWYAVMPVYDLNTVNNVPGASGDLAAGVRDNPVDTPPPSGVWRVVLSDKDTWVPADRNGRLLAERTDATMLEASGEHGDPSHFNSEDLARFAEGCVER